MPDMLIQTYPAMVLLFSGASFLLLQLSNQMIHQYGCNGRNIKRIGHSIHGKMNNGIRQCNDLPADASVLSPEYKAHRELIICIPVIYTGCGYLGGDDRDPFILQF